MIASLYFFRTVSLWFWILNISLTSIYSAGRAQEPRDLSHTLTIEEEKYTVTLNANAEIIISYVVPDSVTKFHKIQNDRAILI